MPYTVNGIGTWYWGKRNLQTRMGTCEFCQRFGELKSYDTTLYFVIVYLPVIPLGRKRILDECPSCQRHRVTSLQEYQAARQKALSEAIHSMKAAPNDPAKTRAALEVMLAYQDRQNFDLMAAAMSSHFQTNEDIQALLAEGHMFFSNHEAAEKAWRRVLQIHDTSEHRERLAACLVVLGRPADAAPWIGHLLETANRERVGLLYLLVEGYQAVGQHAEALALMDRIEAVWPDLAKDKGHRKYRSVSTKRLESGKPVKSAILQKPKAPGGSGIDWSGRMAKVFLPAGLVVAAIVYLAVCASMGRSREVFLVNGTATAYTVNVNGQERRLPPARPTPIALPEGAWDVSVPKDSRGIEPVRIPVHTPFFSRPFARRTLVINPDRVAIVVKETTTYTAVPNPNEEIPYTIHTGDVFYEFKGIDYPFAEFPERLQLSGQTARAKKTRLLVHTVRPSDVVQLLFAELGKQACCDYVARRAVYEPEESVWLHTFAGLAQPEAALKVVRTRLETRPLLIEWHRMYQALMQSKKPEYDLAAEYRRLLDQEPDNRYLKYLLARITTSREEADKLYLAAEEGTAPIGYGYHAMAYYRLCQGAYGEALSLAAKAVKAAPEVPQFQATYGTAQEAAGRYSDLLDSVRTQRTKDPEDWNLAYGEFLYLLALKRNAEARDVATRYQAGVASAMGAKAKAAVQVSFSATEAYLEGRFEAYATIAGQQETPQWKWCAAITRTQAVEAAACLAEFQTPSFGEHLLVYIAAREAGDEALAAREWATAVDALLKANEVEMETKALFRGRQPPAPDALVNVVMLPGQKRILLTACGLAYPESRDALFAKARELNFQLTFPHGVVDRVTR